jgi:hypothetical protein
MGRKATIRYQVCIFGWLTADHPMGSVDVTQDFTSRQRAEAFAEAISHLIPSGVGSNGCPLSWVLVYALPDPSQDTYGHASRHCYLSLDPGGMVCKRHEIMPGCYGSPRANESRYRADQRSRVPVAASHPNAWNESCITALRIRHG